ncbi:phospho-N-acetylmuramoyl-pentapeptide-transferase [Streptococcus mutans]|jgi:Phospho-N-acetylmuramoyl-pentapeptide-transferase (EC 2.7.8.13)|uniref:Phospho-N-acetylmuramoyl-pentapeptide-transferase n=1 Tax=Streptococcus mutans serotype c (strain ATCC 700610 / UA159) TaxID=210007 RepID=MRAY_STRMU|nr:phospho-N-acetylmuramoyl-pentapeptide-transferase [Streptococcus mutans]Q8DVM4.1 RecName: Full=Phospho-N-acetylmuramoyl-pentapeptide-transferase; AltName: Full=UDP-MurNAc-pentapeptide phosphotransferase [Streptococcus mutans UA159]AAN58205.1 putative undecaprenyl-phosphate-UDP-MurNAc-pentapeptide transferase [Streptococcus mutans UA159]AJD54866.1 phospho-N-acetylmuramoyl-pentapeptide-transferase [Streptococcus mutans UA159-FR]EMB57944.1 phospho-N-acetylmuramoyl-pentapeptide-transferase [Stre
MLTTTIIAGIISFILTILAMPFFIRFYQLKKINGQQMHEDVKQHLAKAGTPTMGGTVFLLVAALVTFICAFVLHITGGPAFGATLAILFIVLIYGTIGFLDDFLKIFKKINQGLTAWQKMALQLIGGLVFYLVHVKPSGTDSLNLFGFPLHLGVFYIIFILFWVVGFSNAVNLTDGIDGLASISVVISLLTYSVIAYVQNQFDVLLIIISMVGALLGFFVYNHKPAKVFMGDVGSLALGAMLAAISITLRQEWTLLIIGIVYVLETASVMLQVSYFKWTKKRKGEGQRIFRMTPFHHHLELGGLRLRESGKKWSEWQVDFFLWSIGLLGSLLILAILYL